MGNQATIGGRTVTNGGERNSGGRRNEIDEAGGAGGNGQVGGG